MVLKADEYEFRARVSDSERRLCPVFVATNDSVPESAGSFEMEKESTGESLFLLWRGI